MPQLVKVVCEEPANIKAHEHSTNRFHLFEVFFRFQSEWNEHTVHTQDINTVNGLSPLDGDLTFGL